jgi:hypothetical protein
MRLSCFSSSEHQNNKQLFGTSEAASYYVQSFTEAIASMDLEFHGSFFFAA